MKRADLHTCAAGDAAPVFTDLFACITDDAGALAYHQLAAMLYSLRVVAPAASKRAPLEKDNLTDSGAIMYSKLFYVENYALHHLFSLQPRIARLPESRPLRDR